MLDVKRRWPSHQQMMDYICPWSKASWPKAPFISTDDGLYFLWPKAPVHIVSPHVGMLDVKRRKTSYRYVRR